jgi:glycosyltransferase involved in cell wall biosynthesis
MFRSELMFDNNGSCQAAGHCLPKQDICAPLTVDISAYMRGIAHQLAAELQKRSLLNVLYTSHPMRIPDVSKDHLCNLSHLKVMEALCLKFASWEGSRETIWAAFTRKYDKSIARRIALKPTVHGRVLHGWASHCIETLKVAKAKGYMTFLESACPHPNYKSKVLSDEAALNELPYKIDKRWIELVSEECDIADYIVVPSSYSYDSFIELGYPKSKVVKVPLGVDTSEIRPTGHTSRLANHPFRVLMVGTDALRKGAYYLLRAWNKLNLPDSELVVRCAITQKAAPMIGAPNVRHLQPLQRRDLIGLFEQATVFCFPSVDDGFGLVVLEAMAAGLPVIVTENVGAKDLITNGVHGFVVPIRDVDKLAEKIEFFFRNPDAVAEMGKNARRQAEKYDWSTYGERIVQVYQQSLTHH